MFFERISRVLRAALLCWMCVAAGCGGSGSSGFDGEPATGEPEALMRAVEEGTCLAFEDVTYCGSGAPFSIQPDFVTVEIEEPSAPITCAQSSENVCEASVTFTPIGFDAGTIFLIASADSFAGPWTLSNDTPAPSTGGPPEDQPATVELPSEGSSAPPPSPLVIAVLVYFTPPGDLPSGAPVLSEFVPDVVYATGELEVSTSP